MQITRNNGRERGRGRPGRRTAARTLIAVAAAGLSLLVFAARVHGQDAGATRPTTGADLIAEPASHDGRIRIGMNKTSVVTTRVPYKQVSIGQPDVADVTPVGPNSLLITAKKQGATQLIVWDEQNRSQQVDVVVEFNPQSLQEQLDGTFPDADIHASSIGDGIVLRGRVPNLQTAEQAVALAGAHSEKVLNFLTVSGGQQVMLQVRFAEVSRSATNALGVNVGFSDGNSFGASNIGQVNPFQVSAGNIASSTVNPAVTIFGRAQVGSTTIDFFINALRQNNLLRILAEPNLIAMSGQEANFLAGGEFPIPVTQSGELGGGQAITIEYREFGVRLKMVPVVLGDGRIRLKVAPEVSDLDFTTAVRFGGFVVPGLSSRKLETTVELADGQTFAIAGLLNNSITATKDVTPVLGDVPLLGALFRSVRYQRKETELVVLVTPRLVEALNPGEVPTLPGEHWRDPNEAELFLGRDLGGERPAAQDPRKAPAAGRPGAAAATYQGEHGFRPQEQANADADAAVSARD